MCPDAAKETLQQSRYMGTIRFLELPVFLGIMAALWKAVYAEIGPKPYEDAILEVAGLILAVVFCWLEISLSRNILRFQEGIRLYHPIGWEMLSSHRGRWANWVTRLCLFVPYLMCAYLWSYSLWSSLFVSGLIAVVIAFLAIAVWVHTQSAAFPKPGKCRCHRPQPGIKAS